MIATWMLYCSLCALGLGLAAALAEHALLVGRAPVRGVWVAAVALSLIVPTAAYRFAPRSAAYQAPVSIGGDITGDERTQDAPMATGPSITDSSRAPAASWSWRAMLSRADRPLVIAWIGFSAALGVYFVGGIVALSWMRRRWERRDVLGVGVFVSDETGPAVVGAIAPAIVVPEWVLSLEEPQLSLMLRHEQEHQRAGDGRLLTLAQLAVIAMPWNVALWWQVLRLRVAVELDCDARVLRDGDVFSYGDLLLKVAHPRRGPRLIGATAFAERASQLERRIRVLRRHRVRTSRAARAVATSVGLAAVTAAWIAPRPPVLAGNTPATPRFLAAPPVASDTAPQLTTSAAPMKAPSPQPSVDKPVRVDLLANATPVVSRDTPSAAACGRVGAQLTTLVDSVYARLFEGITLTSAQEVIACDILSKLQREQILQDQKANVALLVEQTNRLLLVTQRNAALRELLTTDADRAEFDARAARPVGFGRGRSGGPSPDGAFGARGGGRGLWVVRGDSFIVRTPDSLLVGGFARGGGRGGRAGRGGASPADVAALELKLGEEMADRTLHQFFDGFTLTADQEATARALIARTQQELQLRRVTRAPALLRLNPATGVVSIQAESATLLIGLMTNDGDRATLQTRIVSIP